MISSFAPAKTEEVNPNGKSIDQPMGWTDVASGGSAYIPVGYDYETDVYISYMYYIISLSANTQYTISTDSYGGAPIIIYDINKTQVAAASCGEDPDTGEYSCEALTYTPSASGLFIIRFAPNDYYGMGEGYNATISPSTTPYSPIQPAVWIAMKSLDTWGFPLEYRDTFSALYAIPTDGLVFYAPLTEAQAKAVTGQTLTLNGTVSYSDQALVVDSGKVTFNIGSEASTGTKPLSVAIWYKGTFSGSSDGCLLCYGSTPFSNTAFCLFVDSSGHPVVTGNGSGRSPITSTAVITDGVWHSIVCTWRDGHTGIYVDGKKTAEGESPITIGGTDAAIGGAFWGDYNQISGSIKAARVYNRVLTAVEVLAVSKVF